MQLSSQIKHQSPQSDRLSIFFGQSPRQAFPTARVGLSTATPRATTNAHAFCGVSVSIPIANPALIE